MSGTAAITTALKGLLRQSGITYAQAAKALDLSEASIKRLFAEQSFTLQRIEALTKLAGAELTDLLRLSDDQQERIEELSAEAEEQLAKDPLLLLCAICVINRYRFNEVLERYRFDVHDLQRLFVRLDRLNIIELLEDNRYRMRLSRGFHWRPGGAIESYFVNSIFSGFFDKKLIRDKSHFRFAWGTVAPETAQKFIERLRVLYDEFNEAADRDSRLPIHQRGGSGLILAFRTDWEPVEFANMRNPNDPPKRPSNV